MKWETQPSSYGLYFFVENLTLWDIPTVAKVSKHTYCSGVTEYIACFWGKPLDDIKCHALTGYWYGPLYTKSDTDPEKYNELAKTP